jgi:hypothetical protein
MTHLHFIEKSLFIIVLQISILRVKANPNTVSEHRFISSRKNTEAAPVKQKSNRRHQNTNSKFRRATATATLFYDVSHHLYQRVIVFTVRLEHI